MSAGALVYLWPRAPDSDGYLADARLDAGISCSARAGRSISVVRNAVSTDWIAYCIAWVLVSLRSRPASHDSRLAWVAARAALAAIISSALTSPLPRWAACSSMSAMARALTPELSEPANQPSVQLMNSV